MPKEVSTEKKDLQADKLGLQMITNIRGNPKVIDTFKEVINTSPFQKKKLVVKRKVSEGIQSYSMYCTQRAAVVYAALEDALQTCLQ